MITISENCACPSVESCVRTKIWKEIKRTQLKTYLNTPYSACQSDISDLETGQTLIMVTMVIQNNITPESKLFEIKLQLRSLQPLFG